MPTTPVNARPSITERGWITYKKAAAIRGRCVTTVPGLAKREKWRKHRDGRAVYVARADVEAALPPDLRKEPR